jgi:death-on-curing protein
VIHLDLDDQLHIALRTLGQPPQVRDIGLLESACARPLTTVFGQEAYPTLAAKAAALLHSVTKNHALVDGNKRLGLAATIAFVGLNGHRLTWSNDEAYDFVIAVAAGDLDDVAEIAAGIAAALEPLDD